LGALRDGDDKLRILAAMKNISEDRGTNAFSMQRTPRARSKKILAYPSADLRSSASAISSN